MVGGGYTQETAEEVLRNEQTDLVAFGTPFIANPDLVDRIRANVPLESADTTLFYGGGTKGYADYPNHTSFSG